MPAFTAALLTIAMTWKQPMCLSIKKMWQAHTHNGILLSHKKEWNDIIYNNMDEPGGCDAKWNKSEKDSIIWFHLYVETKSKTNEQIWQTARVIGNRGENRWLSEWKWVGEKRKVREIKGYKVQEKNKWIMNMKFTMWETQSGVINIFERWQILTRLIVVIILKCTEGQLYFKSKHIHRKEDLWLPEG